MKERISKESMAAVASVKEEAAKKGISLDAELIEIDPAKTKAWQPISPDTVSRIAKRLKKGRPWPEDVPLIVVAKHSDGTYEVVDGNHRRAAAIKHGAKRIPAISIHVEALEFMTQRGLDLEEIFEVIAIESDLMRENQELRWVEGNL